jgi:hypothetical protein
MMGTVSSTPASLTGRAVFIVATMHGQSNCPEQRTVISNRRSLGGAGSITLRMLCSGPNAGIGPLATLAEDSGGWKDFPYSDTSHAFEEIHVWGFRAGRRHRPPSRHQYVQKGANIELKQLLRNNGGLYTVTIPAVTLSPTYTAELQLGGWRSVGTPLDIGGEHGNLTVHEVVVYDGALPDSDLLKVHSSLVDGWKN